MISTKLRGTGVALVTPFRKDGSIDFVSLGNLLDHVSNNGVDYLVALGTTSEYVTLSTDEQNAVVNFIYEKNSNKLPLVLGIGGNCTSEVIRKIQKTNFSNIEALLSVSPYYNKPSQKGIIQHFKAIAAASPAPVIIYNVPGRTSSNISAESTLRLANEVENIIGVKEASGDMVQVMNILNNKPDNFLILSGEDALTLPMIAAGANGVISVVANAYPNLFAKMVNAALNNDFNVAKVFHYQLLNFIQMIFEDGNPSGIKAALQVKKITNSSVRLPLTTVSRSLYSRIEAEVNDLPLK